MFLDPVLCLECLIESRVRLGYPREKVVPILNDSVTRTEAFVKSFIGLANTSDPLRDYKRRLNERALSVLPALKEYLADPVEGLKIIAKANAVDVWMPWYTFGEDDLIRLDGETLLLADPEMLYSRLASAGSMAILLDNAGEAVFDIAYAMLLSRNYGVKVAVIARTGTYESDVTLEEARRIAQDVASILGLRNPYRKLVLIGTGTPYPALATGRVKQRVVDVLGSADVVIAKGIANYEAALEYCSIDPGRVIFALKVKCPVLSRILGVPMGAAVVTRGYRCMR